MSLKGKQILIVEDDYLLADAYREALSEKECQVDVVGNGQEALSWLTNATPDLMLLDLIMPKMTGFELVAQMRKQKVASEVPVIILTNLGQESDKEVCSGYGGCHYFVKTEVSLEEVVNEIERQLHA